MIAADPMANIGATNPQTVSPLENGKSYRGPFAIMTILFFMWGFMTVFNDILIPRFKDAFTLNYVEAMLVQFAFFGAYCLGSIAYFVISAVWGDPIARMGYKNGVVIGLLIATLGSALFWPAANLAPRSSIISPGDFRNFPALVQKLNQHIDPVSTFVYQNLSGSTIQAIQHNATPESLKPDLARDLNGIVNGPAVYDPQRFSAVPLQPATKQLLAQNPAGEALARLNRALLVDAYPDEIKKYLLPYWIFLAGLFVVGLGFAMLQIAANPYVTILGPERTASSRLNFAQAFNSVGTTTGPLIGGFLIFKYFAATGANGAESVKVPYLIFCIVFLILAVFFFSVHLPHVGEGKVEPGIGSLKYPHVVLGMVAIFMYVGGEVSVGSAIINFLGLPSVAAMPALEASKYVSLFWGGMLIGRFMGAVEMSEMKLRNKRLLLAGIPIAAFLILLSWRGWDVVKMYLPLLALCWLFFQFGKGLADRTLFVFSGTIVGLLALATLFGGKLAMWCIVGVGLFTSIGWPNIFSLALDRMGVYKSQVSSLLVMAVIGGAILPAVWGKIADVWNPQTAFIVPLIAYAYVAFYGIKGYRIGRGGGQAEEAAGSVL
jgi:FHS family L-fucose permease-like MFS transporter